MKWDAAMIKRRRTIKRLSGTQLATVKAELLAGKALNHADLIAACGGNGGWRLGALIHSLSSDKQEPWPIIRRYDGTRRVATYWLAPGFKPGKRQQELPL